MSLISEVDPPDFGLSLGAAPVRVIKPRTGRRTMPGWFATTKGTLPSLRTETLLELDGLGHFEINHDCELMAAQPHVLRFREHLPFGRGSIDREYRPDLAVRMRDGRIAVVDFKIAKYAEREEWKAKEARLKEAYEADHGVGFRTVTDESIYIEPRHTNVAVMLVHRRAVPDHEGDVAVRAAIATLGLPTTIVEVRRLADLPPRHEHEDRTLAALVAMVMAGEVSFDLGIPLFDPRAPVLPGRMGARAR